MCQEAVVANYEFLYGQPALRTVFEPETSQSRRRIFNRVVWLKYIIYNFACGSVCVWNMVSDIKGGT
jgi:hypothetical protein